MFFVVRSNDSSNFLLGLKRHIVILLLFLHPNKRPTPPSKPLLTEAIPFIHPNKRPTPPSKPLLTEAIPFLRPNKRSTLIQDHFCLRLFPSYFHISESSWPRNTRLLRRLLRLRERIIKMQQKEPKCYSGGKPLFSSNKPTVKQHTEVKAPISSAKMTVKQYT